MDIAQFRLDFPEFGNDTRYTDSMCAYWSALAENLHDNDRFGAVYTNLIELYTAHCLTIQARDIAVSNDGGFPEGQAGAVTSKSVGSVSVDYESQFSFDKNGTWFNSTIYGRQYLQLAKMFGKGVLMAGFVLQPGFVI
jgi:Protein of unknown function (DUF4054)